MRRVLGVLGVPALLLLSLLHTAGAKNTSSITDPLQRVMLRFNLYQVREGMDEKYFSGSQKIFAGRGEPPDEAAGGARPDHTLAQEHLLPAQNLAHHRHAGQGISTVYLQCIYKITTIISISRTTS